MIIAATVDPVRRLDRTRDLNSEKYDENIRSENSVEVLSETQGITTKKWIILTSTSSQVRDQSGTITVAFIQRCDDKVTAPKPPRDDWEGRDRKEES